MCRSGLVKEVWPLYWSVRDPREVHVASIDIFFLIKSNERRCDLCAGQSQIQRQEGWPQSKGGVAYVSPRF